MNTRMCVRMGSAVLVLGGLFLAGCGSGGDSPAVAQNAGVIDLSGVPPNWDKNLPAAQRFVVLAAFNNDAVRDNETGLVWEKSPQTATHEWSDARFACISKTVGNRKGWRLPSIPELTSLVDPSVSPGPTLPAGHPFTNVPSADYWSATTNAVNPSSAWDVGFNNGNVFTDGKPSIFRVWCVRGGMQADQY